MAVTETGATTDVYPIYVTPRDSKVVSLLFSPPNKLELVGETPAAETPIWITFDRKNDVGYVLGSNISAFRLDRHSAPQHIGDTSGYETGGNGPVASCLVKGCLFVANYGGGSASIVPLSARDHLPVARPPKVIQYTRQGVGPVTSRQAQPFAHDATASPDHQFVYICDLGSDVIHHIRVDQNDCSQSTEEQTSTSVAQGSGPRHLSFYRDDSTGAQYAYLASELATTLTAFRQDAQTGRLDMIGQPLLSVPEGTPLGGSLQAGPQRTTAEVAISPDGRFVYVSNRGDDEEDHITLFSRGKDGSVAYVDWFLSGGQMPRHFSMSNDGKYLAVAHETTGNVVILQIDQTSGHLAKTGAALANLPDAHFAGFFPPQAE